MYPPDEVHRYSQTLWTVSCLSPEETQTIVLQGCSTLKLKKKPFSQGGGQSARHLVAICVIISICPDKRPHLLFSLRQDRFYSGCKIYCFLGGNIAHEHSTAVEPVDLVCLFPP